MNDIEERVERLEADVIHLKVLVELLELKIKEGVTKRRTGDLLGTPIEENWGTGEPFKRHEKVKKFEPEEDYLRDY